MENDEYWDDDLCEEIEEYDAESITSIQEEYRRKRLIESLLGPVISTVFHLLLIVILAIFITDKFQKTAEEIVVTVTEVEEVELDPPIIETPEVTELEDSETVNPVLTTIAVENVETNDAALEDVSDEAPSTQDDSSVEAVSDIVVSQSVFASPSVFGGRSAAGRAGALAKFGGTKTGQASLLKALVWLAKVQNPDGSWGQADQPAHTGLALLTFLAHGETHLSQNFGKTVQKAITWLCEDPVRKRYPGHGRGYEHAIKTYALAEAYAMTGISDLEYAMNRNMRVIIDGQQEGGSFDYRFNAKSNRQDLSLAGWNYQAMKAAHGAACEEEGLHDAIYKAIDWLKKHTSGGNVFPYSTTNDMPSTKKARPTMRAVGTLCLQLFGEGDFVDLADDLELISTVDYDNYKWPHNPANRQALYGWYYATQAMFQQGGDNWKKWNKRFQRELQKNQHAEGYWRHESVNHKVEGGELTIKIYSTCLAALQLTVYYRYLPSSKGAKGAKQFAKKEAINTEDEGIDLVE